MNHLCKLIESKYKYTYDCLNWCLRSKYRIISWMHSILWMAKKKRSNPTFEERECKKSIAFFFAFRPLFVCVCLIRLFCSFFCRSFLFIPLVFSSFVFTVSWKGVFFVLKKVAEKSSGVGCFFFAVFCLFCSFSPCLSHSTPAIVQALLNVSMRFKYIVFLMLHKSKHFGFPFVDRYR